MDIQKSERNLAFNKNEVMFKGGYTQDGLISLYNKWASQYERDMHPCQYSGPAITAETCSRFYTGNQKTAIRILDVAAGTGVVGVELRKRGFLNIDALDPSQGMLEEAKKKNVYSQFQWEFLSAKHPLPVQEGTYDCVTSCGGFGNCHIPFDAVQEIIRITKQCGFIILAITEEYLEDPEYKDKSEPFFQELEENGKWRRIDRQIVPNYAFDKNGVVFAYVVL